MTVARRNRVWTPELRATLRQEVDVLVKGGSTRRDAFNSLSGKWGACADTLSSAFYFKGKEKASKPSAKSKDTGGGLPTNVVEAINVLKGLGISVTLSF